MAVPDLYDVVRNLAAAPTAMILTARGAEQHADGTDTAQAWNDLALAPGCPAPVPCRAGGRSLGRATARAARARRKADQLPGYRSIRNAADRAHVAAVWGVDPDERLGSGVSADELLDRLGTDDGVRALLVSASNPVVSAPNARHVEERLRAVGGIRVRRRGRCRRERQLVRPAIPMGQARADRGDQGAEPAVGVGRAGGTGARG